jgi:hypothetical protein
VAQFIRWNVDGVLYPAAAYWDVYYRPDLVRQTLSAGQSPAANIAAHRNR